MHPVILFTRVQVRWRSTSCSWIWLGGDDWNTDMVLWMLCTCILRIWTSIFAQYRPD